MRALKKDSEMGSPPVELDTRVARLETHMEHMGSNITRILTELHDLRTSTEARFEVVNQKFDAVNERITTLHVSMSEKLGEIKIWALTVLGGGIGFGILTVIARAFHWI
jgi:predicted  nucleic acid-binding Zn-ribbon protein